MNDNDLIYCDGALKDFPVLSPSETATAAELERERAAFAHLLAVAKASPTCTIETTRAAILEYLSR